MITKILSFILSIIMIIPNTLFSGDILSSLFSAFKSNEEIQMISEEYYIDENGAMHKRLVDEDGNEVKLAPTKAEQPTTRADSVLPSNYDARNDNLVTSVKSQGSTGCCWAFSTASVMESSLIAQGYETKDSVDISEAHIAWFTNKSYVADSSDPLGGDGIDISNPFALGGSWTVASFELATWAGAALDKDFLFNAADTTKMEFAESGRYSSAYHLSSAEDYADATRDEIKQAIMDNGSISSSIFYNVSNRKSSSLGYCYYQNVETGTNHAITLVGWNDDFPASYFATAPSSNGAWLVKNSWGSTWGTSGYFWLSYEDTSLCDYGALKAEPADNYKYNYQYDGFGALSYTYYTQKSKIYGANIFTATGNQQIEGSGFYTKSDGTTCKVSVYKNITNSSSPTSGTLLGSKTQYYKYNGYHTLKFDTPYDINKGETFSIVVESSVTDGVAYLQIEGASSRNFYSDEILIHYSSDLGQSFMSSNGTSWLDTSSRNYNNVPIKAFTNDRAIKFEVKDDASVTLEKDNMITGIQPGSITSQELVNMCVGDVRTDDNMMYTGKVLTRYNNDGTEAASATVVVFGDVTGDGISDGTDAFIISAMMYGMLNEQNTEKIYIRAADCNNDGVVNANDYNIAFNSGLNIS